MRVRGSGIPKLGKDTTRLSASATGFIAEDRLVGMVGLDAPGQMIELSAELRRQTSISRERPTVRTVPPTPGTDRPAVLPPACREEPVGGGACAPRADKPDLVRALPDPRR